MERLLSLRKDIINKTSSIDKFRAEMVAQVERGEFDELLLSQADIGMDTWTCVSQRKQHRSAQNLSSAALQLCSLLTAVVRCSVVLL